MRVIICDKCSKEIKQKKIGDKYAHVSVYERKIENGNEANYFVYEKDVCFDCLKDWLGVFLPAFVEEKK